MPPPKHDRPLSPKQARFADEYLIDLNGTRAAIRCGYSARTAGKIGSELLRNPRVAAAIAVAVAERAERTQIDADWVLRRLTQDVCADVADLYDSSSGDLRPVHEWPEAWRTGLVAGIDTAQERAGEDADGRPTYVTVRKLRLADRTRLIELLGKHVDVGAFRERVELGGQVTLSQLVLQSMSAADGAGGAGGADGAGGG
jgi:phage terminase small subunit